VRRAEALAFIAAASAAVALPAAAQSDVGGIAIGSHIGVVIASLGMPLSVDSLDTGHTWTWRTAHAEVRAITDDDAIVRAVEDKPLDDGDAINVAVEGKTLRVKPYGYTTQRADDDLNAVAALSSRTWRLFNLGRNRALVMLFGDDGTLTRAVYGERGFIAHLGLITTDAELLKSMRYVAPKLRGASSAPLTSGSHETIVKYQIDRTGAIDSVAVEVSSKDPGLDQRALQIARKTKWMPAKLNNQPVKSVVFRMIAT
jgi:TonB family protein